MRRLIVLTWLLGCSADGAGDDDQPPLRPPEDDGAEKDREECRLALEPSEMEEVCPPWWARRMHVGSGASEDDPDFVELGDVAAPVCNGRGLYAEPDDFGSAIGGPEITIVRNSHCSVVCYPQCGFTSVCYAEHPDGRACSDACAPPGLTREECAAFVAECLGEDAAACDEDPPR